MRKSKLGLDFEKVEYAKDISKKIAGESVAIASNKSASKRRYLVRTA